MEVVYKNATRWRLVTAILAILCVLLTVGIVVLGIAYQNEVAKLKCLHIPTTCSPSPNRIKSNSSSESKNEHVTPENDTSNITNPTNLPVNQIDLTEPVNPGIFHDLTTEELGVMLSSLSSFPELKSAGRLAHVDLSVPSKAQSIAYLSGSGPKPNRCAKLVFFSTDTNSQGIYEYMYTFNSSNPSLDLIQYPNRRNPVEYDSRPIDLYSISSVMDKIDEELSGILLESYDARFKKCGNKCLLYVPTAVSSGFHNSLKRTQWVSAYYSVDFFTLYPVDIQFYITVHNNDSTQQTIEKIFYGDRFWDSLDEFKNDYYSGLVPKTKLSFPNVTADPFSVLHRRSLETKPYFNKRAPYFLEPDGPRYSVKHNHIEYMNWKFDLRMSTYNGPQVYDIRFLGDRIAYEVGLQEIATFYFGNSPVLRSAKIVDGAFILGQTAQVLKSGVDCPDTATYLSTATLSLTTINRFCVFEMNSATPLRRHGTKGLVDNYLVVRSILVIGNYDYIVDFMFHASGIMETKVISTGYILSAFYTNNEKEYGYQLNDHLLGTIHQHMFHFKVDLDIKGTLNRYETLEVKPTNVSNINWLGPTSAPQTQIKFDKILKRTELEAVYNFNFDTPKEHIFFNKANINRLNVSRGYKVQLSGMMKQLLPEGMLSERSISWARNQLTVTKYKDEEPTSTSIFASFDGYQPVVDFSQFISDNENIIDEDLVLWIAMGLYHIPNTEDLPLTQTPGKHLSFMLAPHNYFDEDPSMASRDQK